MRQLIGRDSGTIADRMADTLTVSLQALRWGPVSPKIKEWAEFMRIRVNNVLLEHSPNHQPEHASLIRFMWILLAYAKRKISIMAYTHPVLTA